jgi:hypothetical protein
LGLVRFCWLVAKRQPAPRRFGEEAATILEFTLVFPLFLMIVLIIWQLLLLVNAAQVVSYAAFSAARSAIVVIPTAVGGEDRNVLANPGTSEKMAVIRRAAAIACTPISPQVTEWLGSAGPLGVVQQGVGRDLGIQTSALLGLLGGNADLNGPRLVQKALYAAQFTDVEVTGPIRAGAFVEDAPLTVRVSHRFFLNVPYANRLFRDSIFAGFGVGAPQRTLTARYTLANEGEEEVP